MSQSLAKYLLGEKLTQAERMFLKSMTFHEGFPVLQKLFAEAIAIAHDDVININPEEPNYDRVLAVRHQREKNINEFCEAIKKSYNANVAIATNEVEKEAAKEEKRREPN